MTTPTRRGPIPAPTFSKVQVQQKIEEAVKSLEAAARFCFDHKELAEHKTALSEVVRQLELIKAAVAT